MGAPEDEDTDVIDNDDYITERQRIVQRFIELGGTETVEMDLSRMPKLADLVTDRHRAMVKDLTAAGLAQEAVARIMGVSKERLQALFDYELGTGYELAHASMARSLFIQGMAGDVQAKTNWLRLHNRTNWGAVSRLEKTDKGAAQDAAEVDALKEAGKDLLAAALTSMSTDKNLFKRPKKDKQRPVKVVSSDKPKPVRVGTTLKKHKGD